MLVSSLVTQPQLQEVRDITTGKSKAYVFSTQRELNDWMGIQDNVAKLVIGDNLYIVDKDVTDYWWDGTDLKVLETELHDMSNVITTLGKATGGGNAITDVTIDGNILTPAKNKNFVDTDYDQSISGQKTFNTTIHSVGIIFQTYDNSSVVCAGGGVRSIADIQSASYSQTEDDAFLLLNADKTQLIDSYTQGETDNLLISKANTRVSYTKGEDDTLLFAKADKTQLIDSYTKGETDNLLISKVNTGISYTKGEDDALLLLKADKTQLIDSYTKEEADNLLNSKDNQSTTYTKIDTDYIISQIETGDVDMTDYYNKTKTDELLSEKVDTTELSNYMTLGTSQTINVNKIFNNACRFVSSIDGMSTVTGSSFIKSGADNTVVLLGAGGTKPISEFTTAIDDSNYVKKDGDPSDDDYITLGAVKSEFVSSIFSGSINGNLTATQYIKSGGTDQQVILANGTTKPISEFAGTPTDLSNYYNKGETNSRSETDNKYVMLEEVDTKLTNYVTTNTTQSITGVKTFNSNVSAAGFAKTDKDDTSVLLAGGGDQLLSSFGGAQ
ncbi:MAG: hypothetical protein EZS28_038792, partial [Streblomastix strix]